MYEVYLRGIGFVGYVAAKSQRGAVLIAARLWEVKPRDVAVNKL